MNSDNEDNKKEVFVKESSKAIEKISIEDFCLNKGLDKYHTESLVRSFSDKKDKTEKDWEKFLVEKKYLDEKILNIK